MWAQSFAPLLGHLVGCSNEMVLGNARYLVVAFAVVGCGGNECVAFFLGAALGLGMDMV